MNRKNLQTGDESVEVQRQVRAGIVISVRLSPEEADSLHDLAESSDKTLSQIAKEALMAHLRTGSGSTSATSSP